jgi:transcriptional regulator with XRE-family HTH domain
MTANRWSQQHSSTELASASPRSSIAEGEVSPLYAARMSRGWTQEQVAELIIEIVVAHGEATGIDANQVGRFERGIYTWPNSKAVRDAFQQLFGCSLRELGFYNKRLGRLDRPGTYHGGVMTGGALR